MDFNAWVGYAPIVLGTIAIGVVTNRLDRGIDVFRRFRSKRRQIKLDTAARTRAVRMLELSNSKHSNKWFMIEIGKSLRDIAVGLTTATICVLGYSLRSPRETVYYSEFIRLSVYGLFEIGSFWFYIGGLINLRRVHSTYKDLLALERSDNKGDKTDDTPAVIHSKAGPTP